MNELYIKVEDLGYLDKYFKDKDIISVDRLIAKMEDLDAELEAVKEEYEDYKETVKDSCIWKW
jgi:hypothetical protein